MTPHEPTRIIDLEPMGGAGAIKMTTWYTFEGHKFPIWFDQEFGLMACLDDLCEIHHCGAPTEVLPRLFVDDDLIRNINPNDTLASLATDQEGGPLEIMRGLSMDKPRAFRFRAWLIDEFHPYR